MKTAVLIAVFATLAACRSATPPPVSGPALPPAQTAHSHEAMDVMNLGPADEGFDLRFIDAMREHHRGAIAMAQEAQANASHPELRRFAAEIIRDQNRENEQLGEWRAAWFPAASSSTLVFGGEGRPLVPATELQRVALSGVTPLGGKGPQFDLAFLNAMIPHHEHAVRMANEALSKATHVEVKQLARQVVMEQSREIEQMLKWRDEWN